MGWVIAAKRASGAVRPSSGHPCAKQAFPSARQAKCQGLQPGVYAPYLREQVDYDYLGKLSPAERTWLAAFTEEWLKGWWVGSETQVLPPAARREANAARQRLRRHRDPLAFAGEREAVGRALAAEGPASPEDEMVRAIDRRRSGRR